MIFLITGAKFLILILAILAVILIDKKILKRKRGKSQQRRFMWEGILIWTFFYMICYLMFYSVYIIMTLNIFPHLGIFISLLIKALFVGLLSGWLIMLLLLKKIKKPMYIGATIVFLVYLFGNFIPGYNLIIAFTTSLFYKIFNLSPLTMGWGGLIFMFIFNLLVLILMGALAGLIVKLRKNKIIWIILILIMILPLLLFVFKKPNIMISHTIPKQIVNPIEATDRININYNVAYEPFLSLKVLKIEQSGRLIYSQDLSNSIGMSRPGSYSRIYSEKIKIDPDKLFENNFVIGNQKTSTIIVTYSFLSKEYRETKDFTIEIVKEIW